jgi:hypothetical protein
MALGLGTESEIPAAAAAVDGVEVEVCPAAGRCSEAVAGSAPFPTNRSHGRHSVVTVLSFP